MIKVLICCNKALGGIKVSSRYAIQFLLAGYTIFVIELSLKCYILIQLSRYNILVSIAKPYLVKVTC